MVPVNVLAWGVLAGLGLGLGLWAMLAALPRFSRPRFEARLAPYLVDVSAAARAEVERGAAAGSALLGALFGPTVAGARDAVLRWLGGEASVARRLRQAGSAWGVERFRFVQFGAGVAGALVGLAVMAAFAATRPVVPVGWVALAVTSAVAAFLGCDALLSRLARRRLARLDEEFPTLAELLALSLAAGEGIYDAVRRVAHASSGELGAELRLVVADVNLGVPLADALDRMGRTLGLAPLQRFIDAVTGALERGAPLAEVLRAQAGDARAERKRVLLELAGRKEVAMLLPLVFGLLPLTVLIAVFPGVFILRTGL